MTIFVDSSIFMAAADRSERRSRDAKDLLQSADALVTSDHVLVETWLLLLRRLGFQAAERFWEGIRAGVARVELVGHGDVEVAWRIGELFADQHFSLVDRTSFAVMERLGVHRAASFDSHFSIYRFGARRDRAFTVLPGPG